MWCLVFALTLSTSMSVPWSALIPSTFSRLHVSPVCTVTISISLNLMFAYNILCCVWVFFYFSTENHHPMLFFHDHSHVRVEFVDQQFRAPRSPLHQGIHHVQSFRFIVLPLMVNANDEFRRRVHDKYAPSHPSQ